MAGEQIPEAWIGRRVIVAGQNHSIKSASYLRLTIGASQ